MREGKSSAFGFKLGNKTTQVIADFILSNPKPEGVNIAFFTAATDTVEYFTNREDPPTSPCEADAVVTFNSQSAFLAMTMLADFLSSSGLLEKVFINDPDGVILKLYKNVVAEVEKRQGKAEI